MLYDPKWQAPEVKADPFTLESLIAWLERQPADQEYNYGCNGSCLLALYFAAHGLQDLNVGAVTFAYGPMSDRRDELLPRGFDSIAHEDPWTFGAALDRARTALTSTQDRTP